MTLAELEKALDLQVADASLKKYYQAWINAAILDLATDYDLPALRLLTPVAFPVTTTTGTPPVATWLFALPTDFHKKLFRCTDSDYNPIYIYNTVKGIDDLDIDHDDTGNHVTHVAVTPDNQLAVYPRATETLYLWYFRLPQVLALVTDVPDLIPLAFHERVLQVKCLIKAYEHLQDQVENFDPKPLQYWQGKLREGLFGIPGGPTGLLNYLAMSEGGPRRSGGRDPVGARGYY